MPIWQRIIARTQSGEPEAERELLVLICNKVPAEAVQRLELRQDKFGNVMTIKAQTTSNELLDRIGDVLERGLIVSPAAPEIVALFDEIDKLDNADHAAAVEMRALLLHITGDLNGALAVLDQCQQCDPLSKLVVLSNYSKCAEARKIYAKFCAPSGGFFTLTVHFARAIGAFRLLAEFARQAQQMKLSNLKKINLEEIFMVDHILATFGVSDEITGDLMETAGSVLADHGLMFVGESPEIDVFDIPGEFRAVQVTYHVPAGPKEVSDIYLEFIERLLERDQSIPRGFHISFEGQVDAC